MLTPNPLSPPRTPRRGLETRGPGGSRDGRERRVAHGSCVPRARHVPGGRARQPLSDIARRAGLPVATCHRIVERLTERGAARAGGETSAQHAAH
ncbi:helix-turn-helix domain-containing protein [Microbacterium sp. SORGH_AS_0888]|uniref:helix-turn-helix domain-containing protein n=1 Tax=Microbacterium sp. SORGH_AS_0888 TaxID=3041791 RepID=UPI00358FF3D4